MSDILHKRISVKNKITFFGCTRDSIWPKWHRFILSFILQSDVGHIEDLFVHLERIFSVGGIWPFERTYVRFAIYITYFTLYLIMAYMNLWDVLGNLELMVMNLVETVAYSITFPMMWVIRCSGLLKRVIDVVRKDMIERKFEDPEEERIYYYYNYTSKIFLYGSTVGMFITVTLLYFRPLMSFSSNNQGTHTRRKTWW